MKTLVRERRHEADSGSNGSHLLDSAAALMAVVNGMQTRVMVADLDLNLVFVNDLALATLRKLEPQLISSFRVSVDQLLGGSIHRFHKDPARIEQILRNVGQLPRRSRSRSADTRCRGSRTR